MPRLAHDGALLRARNSCTYRVPGPQVMPGVFGGVQSRPLRQLFCYRVNSGEPNDLQRVADSGSMGGRLVSRCCVSLRNGVQPVLDGVDLQMARTSRCVHLQRNGKVHSFCPIQALSQGTTRMPSARRPHAGRSCEEDRRDPDVPAQVLEVRSLASRSFLNAASPAHGIRYICSRPTVRDHAWPGHRLGSNNPKWTNHRSPLPTAVALWLRL